MNATTTNELRTTPIRKRVKRVQESNRLKNEMCSHATDRRVWLGGLSIGHKNASVANLRDLHASSSESNPIFVGLSRVRFRIRNPLSTTFL